jgi:hypothetical protein
VIAIRALALLLLCSRVTVCETTRALLSTYFHPLPQRQFHQCIEDENEASGHCPEEYDREPAMLRAGGTRPHEKDYAFVYSLQRVVYV